MPEQLELGLPEIPQPDVAPLEQADEQLYEAQAPRGSFTKNALNGLVKATNRLLPAFEQSADYPKFEEDIEVFPTDFTRVLSMFAAAVSAAAAEEVVEPELVFAIEDIIDDTSVHQVAGKITSLSKLTII